MTLANDISKLRAELNVLRDKVQYGRVVERPVVEKRSSSSSSVRTDVDDESSETSIRTPRKKKRRRPNRLLRSGDHFYDVFRRQKPARNTTTSTKGKHYSSSYRVADTRRVGTTSSALNVDLDDAEETKIRQIVDESLLDSPLANCMPEVDGQRDEAFSEAFPGKVPPSVKRVLRDYAARSMSRNSSNSRSTKKVNPRTTTSTTGGTRTLGLAALPRSSRTLAGTLRTSEDVHTGKTSNEWVPSTRCSRGTNVRRNAPHLSSSSSSNMRRNGNQQHNHASTASTSKYGIGRTSTSQPGHATTMSRSGRGTEGETRLGPAAEEPSFIIEQEGSEQDVENTTVRGASVVGDNDRGNSQPLFYDYAGELHSSDDHDDVENHEIPLVPEGDPLSQNKKFIYSSTARKASSSCCEPLLGADTTPTARRLREKTEHLRRKFSETLDDDEDASFVLRSRSLSGLSPPSRKGPGGTSSFGPLVRTRPPGTRTTGTAAIAAVYNNVGRGATTTTSRSQINMGPKHHSFTTPTTTRNATGSVGPRSNVRRASSAPRGTSSRNNLQPMNGNKTRKGLNPKPNSTSASQPKIRRVERVTRAPFLQDFRAYRSASFAPKRARSSPGTISMPTSSTAPRRKEQQASLRRSASWRPLEVYPNVDPSPILEGPKEASPHRNASHGNASSTASPFLFAPEDAIAAPRRHHDHVYAQNLGGFSHHRHTVPGSHPSSHLMDFNNAHIHGASREPAGGRPPRASAQERMQEYAVAAYKLNMRRASDSILPSSSSRGNYRRNSGAGTFAPPSRASGTTGGAVGSTARGATGGSSSVNGPGGQGKFLAGEPIGDAREQRMWNTDVRTATSSVPNLQQRSRLYDAHRQAAPGSETQRRFTSVQGLVHAPNGLSPRAMTFTARRKEARKWKLQAKKEGRYNARLSQVKHAQRERSRSALARSGSGGRSSTPAGYPVTKVQNPLKLNSPMRANTPPATILKRAVSPELAIAQSRVANEKRRIDAYHAMKNRVSSTVEVRKHLTTMGNENFQRRGIPKYNFQEPTHEAASRGRGRAPPPGGENLPDKVASQQLIRAKKEQRIVNASSASFAAMERANKVLHGDNPSKAAGAAGSKSNGKILSRNTTSQAKAATGRRSRGSSRSRSLDNGPRARSSRSPASSVRSNRSVSSRHSWSPGGRNYPRHRRSTAASRGWSTPGGGSSRSASRTPRSSRSWVGSGAPPGMNAGRYLNIGEVSSKKGYYAPYDYGISHKRMHELHQGKMAKNDRVYGGFKGVPSLHGGVGSDGRREDGRPLSTRSSRGQSVSFAAGAMGGKRGTVRKPSGGRSASSRASASLSPRRESREVAPTSKSALKQERLRGMYPQETAYPALNPPPSHRPPAQTHPPMSWVAPKSVEEARSLRRAVNVLRQENATLRKFINSNFQVVTNRNFRKDPARIV
ncbi:unnamed protein product [Amoebophrya sp. A25]|nr:unnamed protein product [Amoebophrya sp. A25]|eukprot:GSA25T00015526001.1